MLFRALLIQNSTVNCAITYTNRLSGNINDSCGRSSTNKMALETLVAENAIRTIWAILCERG